MTLKKEQLIKKDELNKLDSGCLTDRSEYISGACPLCGNELEFFSREELEKQEYCYKCKEPFDAVAFSKKLGLIT